MTLGSVCLPDSVHRTSINSDSLNFNKTKDAMNRRSTEGCIDIRKGTKVSANTDKSFEIEKVSKNRMNVKDTKQTIPEQQTLDSNPEGMSDKNKMKRSESSTTERSESSMMARSESSTLEKAETRRSEASDSNSKDNTSLGACIKHVS